MTLYIGGDIVPTPNNERLFINGDVEELLGKDLEQLLRDSKCNILNLETPVSDIISPISKTGSKLSAKADAINGIKKMNINAVGLANNHVLDQGTEAFLDMMDILDDNNINYFGGGRNLEKAREPFVYSEDGLNVSFYACAEHEFSIVTKDRPGANPYDALVIFDDIAKLKSIYDYVIVLYHGGKEFYQYPSPELQKRCRKMVDKGADVVIAQHSHCIGCRENYRDGIIIYGQGNFLFDQTRGGKQNVPEISKSGLLLRVEIDKQIKVTELPLHVTHNGGINLAHGESAKKIMDAYQHRSEQINDVGFVENNYKEFAYGMIHGYLRIGLGSTFFVRIMKRLYKKIARSMLKEKDLLEILNYLQCEAHREVFICGIKVYLDKMSGCYRK